MTWGTPQWRPAEPWWGLGRGTGDRWCGAWSRSWWPDGPSQQTRGHTWWAEAEQLNKGSGLVPRPFQWYWMPPKTREERKTTYIDCRTLSETETEITWTYRFLEMTEGTFLFLYYSIFVYLLSLFLLTVSREAEALMSGRKPTSRTCSRKSWLSIP